MSTIEITAPTHITETFHVARQRELVRKAIAKQSFCTLATTSEELRPHVVGVRYVQIGGALYVTIFDGSIKARNIRQNPRVALCIPIRKYPLVPPYAVQFQGTAELVSRTDPHIVELYEAGRLKGIISKKDYEDPRSIFARITPGKRVSSYGIGVSLRQIMREPTSAIRSVEW